MEKRTQEIAKGVYWVGGNSHKGGLDCNPYLIVEGEEAILIDPGSVIDFQNVYENVCSIIPIEQIKYVILHHQDPDICSNVPLFEDKGGKFEIVTHWRTLMIAKYYGIKSKYYIINEHDLKFTFKTGRTLGFILTPYLHFAGAFTTYDFDTKILFSSDLFGAISYNWELYANDNYIEKMKTFHEHYMPGNSILRPVMELFLTMDIQMIASQHGSIINKNIIDYVKALRDLECGTLLNPIKRDLAKSGGYMSICTLIMKRYASIFKKEEMMDVVRALDVTVDEDMNIMDYNYTGTELWNLIFEQILAQKGIQWLIIIEPYVHTISQEYDIAMPKLFESELKKGEAEALNLNEKNKILQEINSRLENSLRESENKLIRCPMTGLYNFEFFRTYLYQEIKSILDDQSMQNPALIMVSLDYIEKLQYHYGNEEVDEILKNIVFILEDLKDQSDLLFRLQGASFACFIPQSNKESSNKFAERIRNSIASSEKFIEKITVSVGVVCFDELKDKSIYENSLDKALFNVASMRVKIARNKGHNIVCSDSTLEEYQDDIGKILLVDSDEISNDIIKTSLENINYKVMTASNGEEALLLAEQATPILIISGIMLPKMNGYLFREKLLSKSNTKNIPFLFLSYHKNDESVLRASSLGVELYLKKPFMLSELLGIVKNKTKGDA